MALTKNNVWTALKAITSVASNTIDVGANVDVSTYYAILLRIRMGRGTATAFTTAPEFRLEATAKATSPTADDWSVLDRWSTAVGATIGSQAISGTEAAGQTVVTLAAGTNFAAGDYVFFHNTTIGNSEWSRVLSVSGADLTLEEAIVNAQTGATARDQSEQFVGVYDVSMVQRIRLVSDGKGTGQAFIVMAEFAGVTGL